MPEMTLFEKSAAVEIKTNSTPGEFTAAISAIGNVDRQGDKVMSGAFEKAINEGDIPPVYWAHQHSTPPIGEGLEWCEKDAKVIYTGRLFVKGDVDHPVANMVYAGMKSYEGRAPAIRQFSYTYGSPDGGAERTLEAGKAIRLLHEIFPVAEVGPCFLGANASTGLIDAAKAIDLDPATRAALVSATDLFQVGAKADLSAEEVSALPDRAFLLVKDGDRSFPYRVNGEASMALLRKAIEQAPTADIDEKFRERVLFRATHLLATAEAKSLLLAVCFGSKLWDDIEGYEVNRILSMLDDAVGYIQFSEDADDIDAMQSISLLLIALLQEEFGEVIGAGDNAPKAALELAVKAYKAASDSPVLSEAASTLHAQEIARLLLVRATH